MSAPGRTVRAILLPSYQWNPYQRLLAETLSQQAGVEATAVHDWSRRAPGHANSVPAT